MKREKWISANLQRCTLLVVLPGRFRTVLVLKRRGSVSETILSRIFASPHHARNFRVESVSREWYWMTIIQHANVTMQSNYVHSPRLRSLSIMKMTDSVILVTDESCSLVEWIWPYIRISTWLGSPFSGVCVDGSEHTNSTLDRPPLFGEKRKERLVWWLIW